jgi:ribokinase
MKPRVVFIGASCLDVAFELDEKMRADGTTFARVAGAGPGGKGLNQAVAARRLGADAALISSLGKDSFSMLLRNYLATEGFESSRLKIVENESLKAVVVAVIVRGDDVAIISPPPAAYPPLTPDDVRDNVDLIRGAECLVLTLDYGWEVIQAALELTDDQQRPIVLLNPAPLVRGAQELGPLARRIDWVIPNVSEARILLGVPTGAEIGIESLVRGLQRVGFRNVCLTAGRQGCAYGGERQLDVVQYPAFVVHSVDPTGASDAFCAALAVAISRNDNVEEAIAAACMSGAIATEKRGSAVSMPTADQVDRLLGSHSGLDE